jgi:hypothetical protein
MFEHRTSIVSTGVAQEASHDPFSVVLWRLDHDIFWLKIDRTPRRKTRMKYRTGYSLIFKTPATGLVTDLRLAIRGAEFALHNVADEGRTAKATITIPVDPIGLSIRVGPVPLGRDLPQRGVHVPESMTAGRILRSAVRVLSFMLEVPIEAAVLLQGASGRATGSARKLYEKRRAFRTGQIDQRH